MSQIFHFFREEPVQITAHEGDPHLDVLISNMTAYLNDEHYITNSNVVPHCTIQGEEYPIPETLCSSACIRNKQTFLSIHTVFRILKNNRYYIYELTSTNQPVFKTLVASILLHIRGSFLSFLLATNLRTDACSCFFFNCDLMRDIVTFL